MLIVGDLFDSWIEYRNVVPKGYYKLFSKISEFVDDNIAITYLAGNHDFWRGNYFKDEFGIAIQDSFMTREINSKRQATNPSHRENRWVLPNIIIHLPDVALPIQDLLESALLCPHLGAGLQHVP